MLFSIITASYNSNFSIESCLTSILAQSIKQVEIIVIDGQSTDGTVDKIQSLAEKHSNIKLVSEPDKGIYDALNKGLALASGDVIGFVHSDDMLAQTDILEKIQNCFTTKNIDGVYGDLEYVNRLDTNQVVRYWKSCSFSNSLLSKGWSPPHPTLYLKKSVYEKHGHFDLNFKISSDYDFMIRVFKDERLSCMYLSEIITKMRVGGASNKNLKNIIIKSLEDYKIIRKNKSGNLYTLIRKNTSKLSQFFSKRKN